MDDLAWACIRALLHSGAADNEGGAAIVADLIPNAVSLRWVAQLCEHLCLTSRDGEYAGDSLLDAVVSYSCTKKGKCSRRKRKELCRQCGRPSVLARSVMALGGRVALSVNSSTLVASGNVAVKDPGGLCLLPARSVTGTAVSLAAPCCSPPELGLGLDVCHGVAAETAELSSGQQGVVLASPIFWDGRAVGSVVAEADGADPECFRCGARRAVYLTCTD